MMRSSCWTSGQQPNTRLATCPVRYIPLEELADRIDELPGDREIIAYCRGAYCALAHDAVRLLLTLGRPASRAIDGSSSGG